MVSYELAVWNLTEVNRYVRITNGKFIATIHIKTIGNLYFIVCIARYFPGVVPVLSLKR